MRRKLLFILYLMMTSSVVAQDTFAPEVRIESDSKPIDFGGTEPVAPFVGDFDGDGLLDLLVGQSEPVRLRIYRNTGTKTEPRFSGFEWFRADGEIAEFPVAGMFRPQLVDLNGDGILDLVSASWFGVIVVYYGRGRNEFDAAQMVKLATGEIFDAGNRAGCYVVDWDSDGDQDIIIAGGETTAVRWVENQGTSKAPSFVSPIPLEGDQYPNELYGEVSPVVVDWNGDGKLDVLLGISNGSVMHYENIGSPQVPKLVLKPQLISEPAQVPPQVGNQIPLRGRGGNISVADYDGDGRLDILIGDLEPEEIPLDKNLPERLKTARNDVSQGVADYRRLRRMKKKLSPETEKEELGLLIKTQERTARRLEGLAETISELEKKSMPQTIFHAHVWLLRRTN